METKKFNIEALKILNNAGWKGDKITSRNQIKEKLINEGYIPSDVVINFLDSFIDLNCIFYNKKTEGNDDFSFNLDRAFELEVPERINDDYFKRINKKLCPIGTAYREHFVLIMDEEGSIYGAYDDYLVKIGEDFYSAINNIIDNAEFIELN